MLSKMSMQLGPALLDKQTNQPWGTACRAMNYSNGTTDGQMLQRAKQTTTNWSSKQTPGSPVSCMRRLIGRTDCKSLYFWRRHPISLSTWIRTLESWRDLSIWICASCFFPQVKGWMTSSAQSKPIKASTVKPRSAINWSLIHQEEDSPESHSSQWCVCLKLGHPRPLKSTWSHLEG